MIYSVRGKLIATGASYAVIETGGIGFKCNTTQNTLSRLPQTGGEAMLYTVLNVREDAMELFGFFSREELSCYKLLTKVNGVGPKAAISVLSVLSPEQFATAVACGDSKTITKAQGVGAKIAQRICLELKDKMGDMGQEQSGQVGGIVSASSNAQEAVDGLVVLGFNKSEASRIVAQLDSTLSVEQLIKQALVRLNKI